MHKKVHTEKAEGKHRHHHKKAKNLFMIILFPSIGTIGDIYSLSTAFKCLGILGSILALMNFCIHTVKVTKENP